MRPPFTLSKRTYRWLSIPGLAAMWACWIYVLFHVR